MRPSLKTLLVLALLLAVTFEVVPRMLPVPEIPHSFTSEEVLFLQQHLSFTLLDWFMFAVYSFGYPFILFFAGGYLIWKCDIDKLAQYMSVLLIVHALALTTWVVYPVAPPRLADNQVRNIRLSIGGFTESFNPIPYGAFPSLHVADTFLAVIFMWSHTGKKGRFLSAGFFALISFSTIYLGEHYWVDIVGGIAYACGAYFIGDFASERT